MSKVLSRRQVWATPAVLGALSLIGLVAALVADGWGDALSWLALSAPAVACARGLRGPARVTAPDPTSPASTGPPALDRRRRPDGRTPTGNRQTIDGRSV